MINESLTKCINQYSYSIISVVFPFWARAQKQVFFTSHIIFLISLFIYFLPYFSNFYALYIISFSFSLNHVE